MLCRYLPAACLASPASRDNPNVRATRRRARVMDSSEGGFFTGDLPTARDKSCNSGLFEMAFSKSARTGAIAATREGHLPSTVAGFRIPASHAACSMSRCSFRESLSTPRVASRFTFRCGYQGVSSLAAAVAVDASGPEPSHGPRSLIAVGRECLTGNAFSGEAPISCSRPVG